MTPRTMYFILPLHRPLLRRAANDSVVAGVHPTSRGFLKVNAVARGNTRDLRVLWALEEMRIPLELLGMDHPAHDLNTDAYRRLSPFEQIPAIDDDGLILSESAAILIYLAKKAGKLIPSEPAGEAQVVRWCFAAMNSVELPLLSILLIDWAKDAGCSKYRENTVGWANRLLTGLERWLDGREYVATESFTVADILMSHVLAEIKDDALIKPYARIASYRDARMPADGPVRSHRRRALLDLQAIPGVSPRAAHVARHERAGAPGIDRPAPSAQAFSFFISSARTHSARLRVGRAPRILRSVRPRKLGESRRRPPAARTVNRERPERRGPVNRPVPSPRSFDAGQRGTPERVAETTRRDRRIGRSGAASRRAAAKPEAVRFFGNTSQQRRAPDWHVHHRRATFPGRQGRHRPAAWSGQGDG